MTELSVDEAADELLALGRRMFALIAERKNQPGDQGAITRLQSHLLFSVRETGAMSTTEIARILSVSPATASQQVSAMERRGWVTRSMNPADLRKHTVSLTSAGEGALQEVEADRRRRLSAALQVLSPGERAIFISTLSRLAEASLDLAPGSPQKAP